MAYGLWLMIINTLHLHFLKLDSFIDLYVLRNFARVGTTINYTVRQSTWKSELLRMLQYYAPIVKLI